MYLHHTILEEGVARGRAQVEAQWDADKAAIAALEKKQAEQVAAQNAATAAHNAEVINDLQTQLSAASSGSAGLAARLRSAALSAAARSCTVPEPPGGPGAPGAPGKPSPAEQLDQFLTRFGEYDAACQRDAARLGDLISEVKGNSSASEPAQK